MNAEQLHHTTDPMILLVNALRPVKQEILGRHSDCRHGSWNPEAQVEITLTIAECCRVLDAMKAIAQSFATSSLRNNGHGSECKRDIKQDFGCDQRSSDTQGQREYLMKHQLELIDEINDLRKQVSSKDLQINSLQQRINDLQDWKEFHGCQDDKCPMCRKIERT